MNDGAFVLDGNRKLTVSSLRLRPEDVVDAPFVVLVPAWNAGEREQCRALAIDLINRGCVEFCCVGPEADLLHDALDELVETVGRVDVVTTGIQDPTEATQYFFGAAAGGRANLLALMGEHPDLRQIVEQEAF